MRHRIKIVFEQLSLQKYTIQSIIRTCVQKTLEAEGVHAPCEINVLVTDDAGIRIINRETRQLDAATDVLSFPYYDSLSLPAKKSDFSDEAFDGKRVALGSIMISEPRVRAQAEEYGHSYERELAYLACHGLLHILGFDHVTEEGEREMNGIAEKVMEAVGLPREGRK